MKEWNLMSDEKIHTKVSCKQCKNFVDYGYAFEGVDVTDCYLILMGKLEIRLKRTIMTMSSLKT